MKPDTFVNIYFYKAICCRSLTWVGFWGIRLGVYTQDTGIEDKLLGPWKGPNIPCSIQQSFNVINDLSDDKGTPQHIKRRLPPSSTRRNSETLQEGLAHERI